MIVTAHKVGKHVVEQANCPATGPVDLTRPRVGVMHTTEGSFESAYAEFRTKFAPHFLVGKDGAGRLRVVQFVSFGNYASALENHSGGVETNRWAVIQVEVVGKSKQTPWLPDADVADALADIMLFAHTELGVPLSRPFPDKMPGGVWATPTFQRRQSGHWGVTAGWYGHVEVPENAHWDPGYLEWTKLLATARAKAVPSPVTPVPVTSPPKPPVPIPAVPDAWAAALGDAPNAALLAEVGRRMK